MLVFEGQNNESGGQSKVAKGQGRREASSATLAQSKCLQTKVPGGHFSILAFSKKGQPSKLSTHTKVSSSKFSLSIPNE